MIDDVLIIMPAYNEGLVIEETLSELMRFVELVIVIDDGSGDDTGAKARSKGAIVLRHSANLGYGAALKTGFGYALRYRREPYLVTFDADGQHNPEFLESVVGPLKRGEADYVLGSRFLSGEDRTMQFARKIGSRLFSIVTSGLIRQRITDPTSGMIGLTRAVARIFLSNFFPPDFPDADVLIMLSRMGFSIREVPVKMREAKRPGSMHSGVLKPAYYLAKMSVSIIHFAMRGDLKEKRREIESVI